MMNIIFYIRTTGRVLALYPYHQKWLVCGEGHVVLPEGLPEKPGLYVERPGEMRLPDYPALNYSPFPVERLDRGREEAAKLLAESEPMERWDYWLRSRCPSCGFESPDQTGHFAGSCEACGYS